MSEHPQNSSTVDSLYRGLEILRNFRSDESMLSLGEISLRLGVPRATTLRLVETLVAYKFLRQIANKDQYQPAVSCHVLGHALLANSAILRVTRPIMLEMALKFNVNVILGVRERLSMLCLEHCASRNATRVPVGIGMSLPLTTSALGQAWLWAQPSSVQGEVIQQIKSEGGLDGARTIPGLYRAFQEMEEHGYCVTSGEWVRDASAIGTVIVLNSGEVYALSCEAVGLRSKSELLDDQLGVALLEAATRIKSVAGRLPR